MCKRCEKLPAGSKCPAMRALEELTPMGSEFWEDPARCAVFVRYLIDSRWRILVDTIEERNALREQLKASKGE